MTPGDSYHGQPVLKQPVWSAEIPCYFFTGGLAGASAGLAYLSGLRGNELLARRAWGMAMLGIGASPPLLIADLGRPLRFINMLRMFKVTSPMSMGSWILTASGATTTLAAVNAWTGLFPGTARLARPAAAAFGLPLSTYTAALIADTAVPVWHQSHRLLPYVYGAGAALSAGGAVVAVTPPADAGPARRVAIGAALIEVGAKELMHRRLGEHGEPYKQAAAARFGHLSRACNLGGAALLYRWGARFRPAAIAGGALLCAGALSARLSTFRAGYQSAADPKYVVGPQRAGIERGDRAGAARREANVRDPAPALGSPATTRPLVYEQRPISRP